MTAPFRPVCRALWLAKAGNSAGDYEDAFALDEARARFAVADGATEASFAAVWARALAESFISARRPLREVDWLASARKRWVEEVGNRPLPWYAETKRDEGAFATLIGVRFSSGGREQKPTWQALAVGDCCLFQTRGGRLLVSFPIARAGDFDNRPELLGSRTKELTGRRARGRWRSGDRFLLMSDALARWFLLTHETGGDPCKQLSALFADADTASVLPEWANERRRTGTLRNDDVTLLSIEL